MRKRRIRICYLTIAALLFQVGENLAQEVGAPWIVPPVMNIDDQFEITPRKDDSRFIVQKRRKFGVCDKTGTAIVPIEYESISLVDCGWIVASGVRRVLFNAKAEDMGRPYEQFNAFNNGTALVYKNGLCGLINMNGEELVPVEYTKFKQSNNTYIFTKADGERRFEPPPTYVFPNVKRAEDAKARSVVAGHYFVKINDNACGLLNLNRDTVVPPIYRFAAMHSAGYLVATMDRKTWGVIDTRHRTLYPFTAERIGSWTNSGLLPIRSEKKWGLVRFPSGQIVFPFGEFEYIEVYDPEKDLFIVSQKNLKGIINLQRKVLLPCAYEYISQYDHVTTELVDPQKKHGFWHRRSGYLQKPIYKEVRNLGDSLVIVSTDSTHALIDAKNGKVIIPFAKPYLDKVGNYFDSHQVIPPHHITTYSDRLHGLYDRTGKLVVPHDSADIYLVQEDNTVWVCPQAQDSAKFWEHRTLDGKVLQSIPKRGANLEKAGFIASPVFYSNGQNTAKKIIYRNAQGEEQYYEHINRRLRENLYKVRLNGLWGFVDVNGSVVVEPVFESLDDSEDGYIKAKYKKRWGVLKNPRFDYFEELEKGIKK